MALAFVGRPARAAMSDIVRSLADSDPEVRKQAAQTLCFLDPLDARAVDALVMVLDRDADVSVRSFAAKALEQAEDGARVEPALVAALTRDPEPLVRRTAASALASLETVSAQTSDALQRAADADGDPEVRTAARLAHRLHALAQN